MNLHCAAHDKVYPQGGLCPGCNAEALDGAPVIGTAYCGIHDKVYQEGSFCPGCGPVVMDNVPKKKSNKKEQSTEPVDLNL